MITDWKFWALVESLVEDRNCHWCKRKFDIPWLVMMDGQLTLGADVAFHWHDSHGIDPETLAGIIESHLFESVKVNEDLG